jgi:hypothetical protein
MSHPTAPANVVRALLTGLLDDETLLVPAGLTPQRQFEDAVPVAIDIAKTITAHRQLRRSDHGDLVRSFCCPTSRVADLVEALGPIALEPVEVTLIADTGVLGVEKATHLLLDDDRVELVGLQVSLPRSGQPDVFARHVLAALTFAMPSSVEVPQVPGWELALDVLQDDGAERAAFRIEADSDGSRAQLLAEAIAASVRRRVQFSLVGDLAALSAGTGIDPGAAEATAVLAVLAGTVVAVAGGTTGDIVTALHLGPVAAIARAGDCDPRAVRRLLQSIGTAHPREVLTQLESSGLLAD